MSAGFMENISRWCVLCASNSRFDPLHTKKALAIPKLMIKIRSEGIMFIVKMGFIGKSMINAEKKLANVAIMAAPTR